MGAGPAALMPSSQVTSHACGPSSTATTLVHLDLVHIAGRQHGQALNTEGSSGLSRVSAPAQMSLTPTKVSQAFKVLLKVGVPSAAMVLGSHCHADN